MGKLLRVGLVVALGVMAWGCGDDTTTTGSCGAASCDGCCTKTGKCIRPNQITASFCGMGGEACSACSSGQKCNTSGQCVKEACSAASCPGCCQGDTCITDGNSDVACGSGAAPCVACGSNQSCSAGKCVAKGCDATSCANGCCYNGVCFPGTNPSLCGKAGGPCQACSGTQACVNQACGTGGVCDATTCKNGCCLNGVCQAGTAINACGKAGAACQACQNGQQCVNQACAAFACSPTTCATGCCDKNGNCVAGTSEPACGKGGLACATCANGQACQAQVCTNVTVNCSALTCATGCCQNGQCTPGTAPTACGKGGGPCATCGTGQGCVNQKCTCTPQSCPTGCCQGDTCRSGGETGACGKGGAPCVACTATSQKCLNQTCQSDCSTFTCFGCCDAQKVCHDPPNDSNCGYFGVPCTLCTSPSKCDSWGGVCNNTSQCSTSNCSGCCKGGQCQGGSQDGACGEGGYGCEVCGSAAGVPHLYCGTDPNTGGRECIATPASTWDVMLDTVEVKAGVDWDDFLEGGDAPELFVKFTVAGISGQSAAAPEGYVGTFNNALLVTAKTSDLTKAIHFEVYDADTFGDDKVAVCDDWIYPSELKMGETALTTCTGDPNNPNFLRIVFRYKVKAP